MESAVYLQWQINLKSLVQSKLVIAREYHIQPSEIDALPYFEFEAYKDEISATAKKEKEEQEKREKEYSSSKFKTPKVQTPKMPKVSIPKL